MMFPWMLIVDADLPLANSADHGRPPLDSRTVDQIGHEARYFRRLWPSLSPDALRRVFKHLCDDLDLMVEDYAAWDIIEPQED